MVTWVIPARQSSGCAFSHPMMAALVRPSTWASRPTVPAASTNPVCHRPLASTQRFVSGSWAQIGSPRGLIDTQDLHRRRRGCQRHTDVLDALGVHDEPDG